MPSLRAPLLLAAGLFLLLGAGTAVPQRATSAQLGGAQRFVTHVSTDKPLYKPGETVYLRGVALDVFTHAPLASGVPPAQVTITGPRGELLGSSLTTFADGVWGFSWVVPEGSAGGEYTATATLQGEQWAKTTRKFDVRAYRAPRLTTQIKFAREGYGPGDSVSATLEARRAEGGIPKGAKVTAVARVDGAQVASVEGALDGDGRFTATFPLPKAMERGDGSLAFTVEDGGQLETAAKTLPILMQTVDLAFFPEGGDLVAGLPARVYVEARNLAQKPADIAGVVVDDSGAQVATLRTEHEGRGRFAFTPRAGQRYSLKLTEPSSVKKSFPLPAVAAAGATVAALEPVTPKGAKVKLSVAWTGDRTVKVLLSQKEVVLDQVSLGAQLQSGAEVALDAKGAEGVLIATVTEKDGAPLAERLVFRQPRRALQVELKADRERYVPGGLVNLSVRTTVEGAPVAAVVGLTVTDESVLELVDKREQAPSLLPMAFLESEVRELLDAHVYLDASSAKSAPALDLLLGTQGWRRFAVMNLESFLAAQGDAARRVVAFVTPAPPRWEEDNFGDDMVAEGGGGRPGMAPPMPMPERRRPMAPPAPPRAKAEAAPVAVAAPVVVAAPPVQAAPQPSLAAAGKAIGPLADRKEKAMMGKRAMEQDFERVRGRRAFAPALNVVNVREFAHLARPNRNPTDRFDFAETLYWSAAVKTDAKTGLAQVAFAMSDAVTSFRASAGGYTAGGVLGEGALKLSSVQPFFLEPKLPLEVSTGDLVRLPIVFTNGTTSALQGVGLKLDTKGDVRFSAPAPFALGADARVRKVVDLTIGNGTRTTGLTLTGSAGEFVDNVTRELTIKPRGFPAAASFAGTLVPSGRATHRLELPKDLVPGSVSTQVQLFTSPAANLTSALKRMIQEPSGCFEQTSSTTYPMTMALQYFNSHTGVEQEVVQDAKDKLERGYARLTGYECKEKGYEWFGQDPGHEALTAFGLLHFTDMAKVRQVDSAMLSRTRAWMLKARDGKGGFERKRRALHTWVEDKDTSDAYITWALLESGVPAAELKAEVARVKRVGVESKNLYAVALALNVAMLSGDGAAGEAIAARLTAAQDSKSGAVHGAQSIVGSGGVDLDVETTALTALGLLKTKSAAGNLERAMQFLTGSCEGGRYGSTQSTVLALRAIVAFDAQRPTKRAPGSTRLFVDGKPLGGKVDFGPDSKGTVELPSFSELATPGPHTVELVTEGGAPLPYAISVTYNRTKPESAADAPVAMTVALGKASLSEGDVMEATATVTNQSDGALSTVVAIVGLPGGLEPRVDQLKELQKKGDIDAFEVRGRDVVFYWRGMTAKQQRKVQLSLIAAIPGKYTGPSSRAYLYYADAKKVWVDALAVDIAPKG